MEVIRLIRRVNSVATEVRSSQVILQRSDYTWQ
jgi:hypothetical protein